MSFDVFNKSVANNVVNGSLMDHSFDEASTLLDRMIKTNRA